MTIEQAPQEVRDLFHKGMGAMERGQYEYAIQMFFSCLQIEPELTDLRKFLRAAEVDLAKQRNQGAIVHFIALLKGLPALALLHIQLLINKPVKALMTGEALLKKDPLNRWFAVPYSKAAEAAGMPDLSIQILSLMRDQYPNNTSVIFRLGKAFVAVDRAKDARDCFQAVSKSRPNDTAVIKALKDAMALESISVDGWGSVADDGGDFRGLLKDSEEAEILEAQSKAVRSQRDTESLIAETLEKIEQEPENLNYYRSLANLYATNHMFDKALSTIEKAQQLRGGGDPELDATATKIRIQQFDAEIAKATSAGDQAVADAKTAERKEFLFNDLADRVHKYPNDLHLRYEYGVALFERGDFNAAVQQFQLSQKNLKWHVPSLYYTGLCFKEKNQYDLALERLASASAEIPSMDDMKKDILYETGIIQEALGNADEAAKCFKEIYQVDISYRDVAQKVEQTYGG